MLDVGFIEKLPEPKPFAGYLTGIGSRETPYEILVIMTALAAVKYSEGYQWRSGGAAGADEAFEQGVLQHPHFKPNAFTVDHRPLSPMAIYLPWNGFEPARSGSKKYEDVALGYFDSKKFASYPEAQEIALSVHPNPEALKRKRGHLMFHTRNVYQALGPSLNRPSEGVYLWAKPTADGLVTGGTRTAMAVAKQHGIPVYNLHDEAIVNHCLEVIKPYQ